LDAAAATIAVVKVYNFKFCTTSICINSSADTYRNGISNSMPLKLLQATLKTQNSTHVCSMSVDEKQHAEV